MRLCDRMLLIQLLYMQIIFIISDPSAKMHFLSELRLWVLFYLMQIEALN